MAPVTKFSFTKIEKQLRKTKFIYLCNLKKIIEIYN
jgi:hypothetical protein